MKDKDTNSRHDIHVTENTEQAAGRRCIGEVTADLRCPKSKSHWNVSKVSLMLAFGNLLLIYLH